MDALLGDDGSWVAVEARRAATLQAAYRAHPNGSAGRTATGHACPSVE